MTELSETKWTTNRPSYLNLVSFGSMVYGLLNLLAILKVNHSKTIQMQFGFI